MANRPVHNLELLQFLLDSEYRKAAVRGEKLIRNLHEQLGDAHIKQSVILEDGGIDLSRDDKPRRTREQIERMIDTAVKIYVPIRRGKVARGEDKTGDTAKMLAALGYDD